MKIKFRKLELKIHTRDIFCIDPTLRTENSLRTILKRNDRVVSFEASLGRRERKKTGFNDEPGINPLPPFSLPPPLAESPGNSGKRLLDASVN